MPQTGTTSDDYYTPKWIFDVMDIEFDLDVACPPGGCDWIPASSYLTMADDGLSTPWHGRVWMNPPFSGPGPWVRKFIDHGRGVCLIPAAKSKWMAELWSSAAGLVFLPPDLTFVGGKVSYPTLLAAIGADECAAVARVGPLRSVAA